MFSKVSWLSKGGEYSFTQFPDLLIVWRVTNGPLEENLFGKTFFQGWRKLLIVDLGVGGWIGALRPII